MSNRIWWKEWQAGPETIGLEIWDADTQVLNSPTMIEIPAECTFTFSGMKYEYDKKRPLGLFKTPILTVNLWLDAFELSADLRDLRAAILSPICPDEITFVTGSNVRAFRTTTTWRLYYYDPNGDRQDLFIGAQRTPQRLSGRISGATSERASTGISVTVHHLAQIALMEVKPADLTDAIFAYNDTDKFGPKGLLYEFIYVDDGTVYAVVAATPQPAYPNTLLYPYAAIWEQIEYLSTLVYKAYTRVATDTVRLTSELLATGGATPAEHWTHFRSNYNRDGGKGSGMLPSALMFPGLVARSDKTLDLPHAHAGALVDQGQGVDRDRSLYRFRNCWDLLGIELLWRRVKGQLFLRSGGIDLHMSTIYETALTADPSSPHGIAATDILQNDVEWSLAGANITGAKAIIPGLSGDDLADIPTVQPLGTQNEEEMPVKALFHNHVRIGAAGDAYPRFREVGDTYGTEKIPDITLPHVAVGIKGDPSPFELYYVDRPLVSATYLTTVDIPIRVHSEVQIFDGVVTPAPSYGDRYELPIGTGDPMAFIGTRWWEAMLYRCLKLLQRFSGMGYAIAESMPIIFGHPQNVLYEKLAFPLSQMPPSMMGEVLNIGDGTASSWLDGTDTYLDILRCDRAQVVELDVNLDNGTVTISAHHLEPY
jgi:hypothetical protein